MTTRRVIDQIGMGNASVDVIDAGIATKLKHTHDSSVDQKMWQSVSGSAHEVLPEQVRPLRGELWLKVVQMQRPGSEGYSDLILTNVKPLLRHRGVTKDGKIYLFQQGYGEIARFGSAGEQEEWVVVEEKRVVGEVSNYKNEGPYIFPNSRYLLITPLELPKPETLIDIIQPDHVMSTEWAYGMARSPIVDVTPGSNVVYLTRNATEIVLGNKILFAVPQYDVLGVVN